MTRPASLEHRGRFAECFVVARRLGHADRLGNPDQSKVGRREPKVHPTAERRRRRSAVHHRRDPAERTRSRQPSASLRRSNKPQPTGFAWKSLNKRGTSVPRARRTLATRLAHSCRGTRRLGTEISPKDSKMFPVQWIRCGPPERGRSMGTRPSALGRVTVADGPGVLTSPAVIGIVSSAPIGRRFGPGSRWRFSS